MEKEGGGEAWLQSLRTASYAEASEALQSLPGVGPKVRGMWHGGPEPGCQIDLALLHLSSPSSWEGAKWGAMLLVRVGVDC